MKKLRETIKPELISKIDVMFQPELDRNYFLSTCSVGFVLMLFTAANVPLETSLLDVSMMYNDKRIFID